MVKKRLADGTECKKCRQVTDMLKERGYWDRLTEVVWADEADEQSPGMQLAARHGVSVAPFFLAGEDGRERVYTSVILFMRDCFQHTPSALEQAQDQARNAPDDLGF